MPLLAKPLPLWKNLEFLESSFKLTIVENVFEFLVNKKVLKYSFNSFQEQALASSKTSRDKEWEAFKADIEDRSSH